MAEKTSGATEIKDQAEVTFICQRCGKSWSVKKMRRITRFRPLIVVCPECEKAFL